MTAARFAIVGAGTAYLPGIALGIAARAEVFAGTVIVLHDIDGHRLGPMAALARRIIAERGGRDVVVEATTDLQVALTGADLALATFRPGGYPGRISDERLPLAFGLAGCESVGMGGFAMALRSVPAVAEVARGLRRWGAPEAVLLDYVNPVGIVTDAVRRAVPGLAVVGLCDQSLGEARFVATVIAVAPSQVSVDAAGANHCTWTRRILVDGRHETAGVIEALARLEPARIDPYWRFVARWAPKLGMIPSAYLRYYLEPDMVLAEQRARGRTRGEDVAEELPGLLAGYQVAIAAADPVPQTRRGGDDHGDLAISVAAAIRSRRPITVTLDVANDGAAIPGIPTDATVELPCQLKGRTWRPLPIDPLPTDAMKILERLFRHQRLAADAASSGDRQLMLEAMCAHPLAPPPDRAAALLDAILDANRAVKRTAA